MSDSICKRCYHNYVCEQFNEHRDFENKKCHFYHDHFVDADSVEPVRHGEWIPKGDDDFDEGMYRCSVCGQELYFEEFEFSVKNYCPNCGAKMDKEKEE